MFDHFPKYHTNILVGDFNEKLGREDIFKLRVGNESQHQDINGNGVRIVNFATSKNLIVKSTMFPHRKIHKYTWTSTDGKTDNQIDHTLIDRRWHSSILEVRSFRGADYDTDQYLMVAKVRERLTVDKQAAQNFDMESFNLRKLSELEVRKQYRIEISNSYAALESFSDREDMNRAWENIKETIKTSAKKSLGLHELKQLKPWFDEEWVRFLDQRKQAKVQWLQDPNKSKVDDPNTVRLEAGKQIRNKEKTIRKLKFMNLKLTVRSKMSDTLVRASVTVKMVTTLDLI